MKKFNHPFMQMLVMVGISLFLMLVAMIPLVIYGLAGGDMNSASTNMIVVAASQVLMFLLPPVLMVRWYYSEERRGFWKLDFSGNRWLLALAGVVVMLLLSPLTDWLSTWNGTWSFGPLTDNLRAMQEKSENEMASLLGTTTVGGLLFNLLVVAVVPAVCEEAFFRVGLQSLFYRWTGNAHAAVWVTAVIFSLIHLEMFSFMPRLLMGVLLGYLFVYGGSFVVNAAAHFTNNALIVVLYWLAARGVIDIEMAESLGLGAPITILCTLAAVALFCVTFLKKRQLAA